MKTHSFLTSLAAAAGLLCLTSCDSKLESLNMEQFDLQTEVAEILLDCEDVEDVKDAIDDLKAIAEKCRELEKEIKSCESEFKTFKEEEISTLEHTRLSNRLRIAEYKAEGLLADAMVHVAEICKDDKDTLEELGKAFED